jgi:hypothetical protein
MVSEKQDTIRTAHKNLEQNHARRRKRALKSFCLPKCFKILIIPMKALFKVPNSH